MAKLNRRIWPILALAALGLALMLLGTADHGTAEPETAGADWQHYITQLEAKAAELCTQVAGVGDVTVAVSLAQGTEYVYADEYAREAILLTERPPQLNGIAVVCTGGDSPEIVQTLVSLLSAAFGVGTNRIYVTAAG